MNKSGQSRFRRPFSVNSVLAFALSTIALSCGGNGPVAPDADIPELPRPLSLAETRVISESNRFGFRLLREIAPTDENQNLFLSPFSASMALGMTLNGAAGSTYDGMIEALSFHGLNQDEINASYRDLIDLLDDLDPAVTFALANSIWSAIGFPVRDGFLDRVRDHFDAGVQSVDFSDPSTVDLINQWVESHTDGKIEKMVEPPLERAVVMILLNAIYFKGAWSASFDPERTVEGAFRLADGSSRPVKMMEREGEFLYKQDPRFEAVELPYGRGAYAATLVLPRPGTPLSELIRSLDQESWDAWLGSLGEEQLVLNLPRFTLEWKAELKEPLQQMGMTDAFDPARADFTRLTPGGGVWIDKVEQKTFLEINEEGTEAAAATSVTVVRLGGPRVVFDRPFLIAIRERLSGTVFFLGAVYDPGSA